MYLAAAAGSFIIEVLVVNVALKAKLVLVLCCYCISIRTMCGYELHKIMQLLLV